MRVLDQSSTSSHHHYCQGPPSAPDEAPHSPALPAVQSLPPNQDKTPPSRRRRSADALLNTVDRESLDKQRLDGTLLECIYPCQGSPHSPALNETPSPPATVQERPVTSPSREPGLQGRRQRIDSVFSTEERGTRPCPPERNLARAERPRPQEKDKAQCNLRRPARRRHISECLAAPSNEPSMPRNLSNRAPQRPSSASKPARPAYPVRKSSLPLLPATRRSAPARKPLPRPRFADKARRSPSTPPKRPMRTNSTLVSISTPLMSACPSTPITKISLPPTEPRFSHGRAPSKSISPSATDHSSDSFREPVSFFDHDDDETVNLIDYFHSKLSLRARKGSTCGSSVKDKDDKSRMRRRRPGWKSLWQYLCCGSGRGQEE